MDFNYDLEAALKKLPEAIEAFENVINTEAPSKKELLADVAKQVNAGTFSKHVQAMNEAIDATVDVFKRMLGQEGDSVTTGSLYGALASVKKMEAALNG